MSGWKVDYQYLSWDDAMIHCSSARSDIYAVETPYTEVSQVAFNITQ